MAYGGDTFMNRVGRLRDKRGPKAPSTGMKLAVVKQPVSAMKKGGEVKGLTAKQKAKLPKALQDAILKKRGMKK